MNNKQRSSNDEPNRNPNPANERQLAEHTARVLELQPLDAQSKDDQATVELGRLLRDSAQADLPESSVDLRDQLMAELAVGSATESDQVTLGVEKLTSSKVVSKEVSSRSTGRRFWIAAAASGLLLVGGTIAYNSDFVGTLSNVALLDKAEQPNVESPAKAWNGSSPKPKTPEVVFRMETKARTVPIQKTRVETKTRSALVTKHRNETRQVKQADGSVKTETVKVPYTENVHQSYTVQVPYTEQVAQSPTVPVPYTADGKRIERSDYGKYGLNDDGRRGGMRGLKDEKLVTRFNALELESLEEDFEAELESAAIESGIQNGMSEMSKISPSSPSPISDASEQFKPDSSRGLERKKANISQDRSGNLTLSGSPEDVANVKREIERLSVKAKSDEANSDGQSGKAWGLSASRPGESSPSNEGLDYADIGNVAGSPVMPSSGRRDGPADASESGIIDQFRADYGLAGRKGGAPLEATPAANSGSELSGRSSPEDLSRPVEFLSGGEIPEVEPSFGREGSAVLGQLKAVDGRFDLAGARDKDRRSQGFPGSDGLDTAEKLAIAGGPKHIQRIIADSMKKIDRQKAELSRLTLLLARSETAIENDREACMEHIWLLENANELRQGVLEISDNSERVAQEQRMVEELELQRDQLLVVQGFGDGHAKVRALNLAINDRNAKIKALASEGSAIVGIMPEQIVQRYIVGVKQKIGDLRLALSSDLAVYRENYEKAVMKERRFEGEQDYFELLNSDGEQYEPIFENAFIAAKGLAAISTFSIDVDTASYANMRRMLNSGRRPPPNSIRLEELVNYFQYDYAQPTGEHPFSVNLELADCPWEAGQQLLRVGLKGKDIHVAERPPTNVVFLIDVSGSMSSSDKLPLLKSGFQMMSRQLGENDRVSIVTYAGNAGVALEPTNGTQTSTINTAIEQLSSGGSTHGSAGIKLAYELAQKSFIQGGVNRVMLATDGDLNVGVTSDDALVTLIKEKAAEGVFLTVLGFGTGNLKDGKLEKLADNGNGMYAYIDSTREAHRVLVDQLSGSLVTIAKDVKIQVEFNPAEVKSYRLLGYENRMLETKDFDDDAKDAGEIGAGHTVTAIYQIEPAKAVSPNVSLPAGMKYQVKSETDQASVEGKEADKDGLSKAALSGELATVALRYKQPDENESERLEVSIKNQPKRFSEASTDFRFAAGVAGFGMYLRNSEHRGSIDAGLLQRIASESIGKDESGYRSEFIDLIRRASNR